MDDIGLTKPAFQEFAKAIGGAAEGFKKHAVEVASKIDPKQIKEFSLDKSIASSFKSNTPTGELNSLVNKSGELKNLGVSTANNFRNAIVSAPPALKATAVAGLARGAQLAGTAGTAISSGVASAATLAGTAVGSASAAAIGGAVAVGAVLGGAAGVGINYLPKALGSDRTVGDVIGQAAFDITGPVNTNSAAFVAVDSVFHYFGL